ncbi:nucleoside phosphorylase [Lewinella sp. IMCC34183]|uniref:nucleoside phosphorylase n=1 Tax=Lewinella sp. IMCC34183 TaxID=2248762 RepID=UPI000E27D9B7|nr:nucleoside phosphorylase [Lewinella sp. IMCC34183]
MIAPSELILRPDGSVYHLHLLPRQVAETIITVGDPERVGEVSRRFDRVELRVEAREFVTHTGELNGQRLSVVSTGIGTDNVDIVVNELDALFNLDFARREVRSDLRELTFLRLGTSGAFQPDVPLDSFILSRAALSLDGLLPFYPTVQHDAALEHELTDHMMGAGWPLPVAPRMVRPRLPDVLAQPDPDLLPGGITLTAAGFYAPQGRRLRLPTALTSEVLGALRGFRSGNLCITNVEMETAGLYALAGALGHRSASISALLANRALGTFSTTPAATVDRMIDYGLSLLTGG